MTRRPALPVSLLGRNLVGRCLVASLAALSLALGVSGCKKREVQAVAPEKPTIPISHPVVRDVADYIFYTGRTDAVKTTEIRARVTGYLTQMPFKEGAEVKKGDLLFEIDPRPYQAKLDAAKAVLDQRDAAYRFARADNARSKAIDRNTPGSISVENLQKSQTTEAQALADYNAAKADLDSAQLNLDFTKVTSPIDGLVGRYLYTEGNLVNQDQTLLTTVVTVDPMYAYFDIDERTVLKIRSLVNQGKIKMVGDSGDVPVFMALEGETGYPHSGAVNFVNNVVTTSTGTITVRGVFPNPKPEKGLRVITSGMFVRIELPVGPKHSALLVTDRAIGTDQGIKFVYVVDNEKKAQYRKVRLGALQDDGLRVIEEGLKADDWVVVGGLQQVRPRLELKTEESSMPTLDDSAEPLSSPAATKGETGTTKPEAPAKSANTSTTK